MQNRDLQEHFDQRAPIVPGQHSVPPHGDSERATAPRARAIVLLGLLLLWPAVSLAQPPSSPCLLRVTSRKEFTYHQFGVMVKVEAFDKAPDGSRRPAYQLLLVENNFKGHPVTRYCCFSKSGVPCTDVLAPNAWERQWVYYGVEFAKRVTTVVQSKIIQVEGIPLRETLTEDILEVYSGYFAKDKEYAGEVEKSGRQEIEYIVPRGETFAPKGVPTVRKFRTTYHNDMLKAIDYLGVVKKPTESSPKRGSEAQPPKPGREAAEAVAGKVNPQSGTKEPEVASAAKPLIETLIQEFDYSGQYGMAPLGLPSTVTLKVKDTGRVLRQAESVGIEPKKLGC